MEHVLVINAGSSSIKFELFAVDAGDALRSTLAGQLDGIGTRPHLRAKDADGEVLIDGDLAVSEAPDVVGAMTPLGHWLRETLGGAALLAVGHRVVHGGAAYSAPIRIDDTAMAALHKLEPLAPLHQPNNLAPIAAIAATQPDLPQIACFDTAFHRSHPGGGRPLRHPRCPLPGGRAPLRLPRPVLRIHRRALLPPELAQGRTVVAHLGSGASMCALLAGRSVDSTMGFTAVDGLPMGTRTGQIDPGVLLYLMQTKGWDAARLEHFLYHDGGLKGLSGISNDMRDLLASDSPSAALAVDYFVYRITREAGSLAAAMGGIDGIVFTAGIGEHAPAIRERVCRNLAWLGLDFDMAANMSGDGRLSDPASKVQAWVIPTDEELMIARHTLATLREPTGAGGVP